MSSRSSDGLIRGLVQDLRPVRRLPRLRTVLAGAVAAWLLALGLDAWLGGWRPWLGLEAVRLDPAFGAVALGLALGAGAGLLAALAAAVPGRERLARSSLLAALAGLGLTLTAALAALLTQTQAQAGPSRHLTCAAHAFALALAPAGLAGAFLVRAAVRGPWPGLGAALGVAALGGIAVHLNCAAGGGLHWLLGHSLGPLGAAVLLALLWGGAAGRIGVHTPAP